MSMEEFKNLLGTLRVYKGFCQTSQEINAWFESLKPYDYSLMYNSVRRYIESNAYPPTPASLIALIPKARPDQEFKPRYETINGKTVQVVQCRRCMDRGLFMWQDNAGRVYGKPCDCPAGHANYKWGWLTQGEQEAYVRANGHHGEIIGESWK